ncbi:MAG: outer membrane protein assembly factor BamD [Verrucomicrobiota bacterium]
MQNKLLLMAFATKRISVVFLLIFTGILKTTSVYAAEDILELKSGQVLKGEIKSIDQAGNIVFSFEGGTIPYRKNTIKKATLQERPAYKEAQAAIQQGDYSKAITVLQPLVQQFLGISSPWVGQAAGDLANALARTGKTFESQELAARIISLYPNSSISLQGPIIEAQTMLVQGKADEALGKLDSIKGKLPSKLTPDLGDSQILGDYHFILAQAQEQKGDKVSALENYLTVSALYPNPKSRAQQAQEKADALLKEDPNLAVR